MEDNKKKKKRKVIIITVSIIVLLLIITGGAFLIVPKILDNKTNTEEKENTNTPKVKTSAYTLSGNSLEDFDLYFLQLENAEKNTIYSPLSIKYALAMLSEGTNGNSKNQITNIIGSYGAKKYINSNNMSFANGLFVRDTFKDAIKQDYINTLTSKYNAEVIIDSFNTPDNLNSWVSQRTFKLIDKLFDGNISQDFILINALAIDMEWVKKIQSEHEDYIVHFEHEYYTMFVSALDGSDYHQLKFNNLSKDYKSAEIGAVVNRYDIVNVLGEDSIRKTVGEEYKKWLKADECGTAAEEPSVDEYLNSYIKDINSNYKHVSSSTDFLFYDDDNVMAFAKDLKKYNGTTLQYVGIMPKSEKLTDYIKNVKAKDINEITKNLKDITLENFEEGYVTEITGYIPMFKFDYELNLMDDLKQLGITDVFDSNKADLSNLTSKNAYIDTAIHKSNIEFSNDGIKASAATAVGGKGAFDCSFDYLYEVPTKTIDLTFDKPYLFFVRDKETGEVWFTGTVYEPVEYEAFEYEW